MGDEGYGRPLVKLTVVFVPFPEGIAFAEAGQVYTELGLGLIFILIGALGLLVPDVPIRIHTWSAERLEKPGLRPTEKTRTLYRIAGAGWFLVGALLAALALQLL